MIAVARPAILERLPHDRHAVIEASAGTGKTFTLEHLVIDLLLTTDATIEQILVVTYTERASLELRSRIRLKLESYIESAAGSESADPAGASAWILDDDACRKLNAALQGFDAAPISTIHSFCQRVLLENAFFNGRLFDQVQIDARAAFGAAFKQTLRQTLARDEPFRSWLHAGLTVGWTVEQIELLLFKLSSHAGCTTGGFDFDALTAVLMRFPVDAARDPALGSLLKAAGVKGATQGAVVKKLRALADLVDHFRSTDDVAYWLARMGEDPLDKALAYLDEKLPGSGAMDDRLNELRSAVSDLAPLVVSFEAALGRIFLPPVRELLDERKRREGLFDFNDMLTTVRDGLYGDEGAALVETLRQRYRYALIDEFQDTDDVQWSIFRKVFFESRGENPMFLIGDPKQAIYGFRGADVHTYQSAVREVQAAGGSVVRLGDNYRSSHAMIEACNAILTASDVGSDFFEGEIRYDDPVRCGDPDRALTTAAGTPLAPIVVWKIDSAGGEEPTVASQAAALGQRIAEEINALTTGSERIQMHEGGRAHGIEANDIFVLTRTWSEAHRIGDCLQDAGIRHVYFKEEGLFQTEWAQSLSTLFSAIDDPLDVARRSRAWLTPFFGLTLSDLVQCGDLPPAHPLISLLIGWKALADRADFEGLFGAIQSESGVLRRLLFAGDDDRDRLVILQLFERLLEQARQAPCTFRELLNFLRRQMDAPSTGQNDNFQRESEHAVRLMTVHACKGLEAAVVFLAGGFRSSTRTDPISVYYEDGGRKTHVGRASGDRAQRVRQERSEEDARLLYVALTRAKVRLYLPWFDDAGGGVDRGPYQRLNGRFPSLLESIRRTPERLLFHCENLDDTRNTATDTHADADASDSTHTTRVAPWSPPASYLSEPDRSAEFATMRRHAAGAVVSSYTQLKMWEHALTPLPGLDELGSVLSVEGMGARSPDDLPGGATSGIFLHAVLEKISLATFIGKPSFETWRVNPDVASLFDAELRRHVVHSVHRRHAEVLVYRALQSTFEVKPDQFIAGLANADRTARELEFLFVLSDTHHVYIKGFMDFVFAHGGRTYCVDWKSDVIPPDVPLARHADEHYMLQAKIYSIAMLRLLKIQSEDDYERLFGAFLFCFLRELTPETDLFSPSKACVRFRPSWSELVEFENGLIGGERAW